MDSQKLICDSCCENNRALWHRIKAIDIGSIQLPPVVIPEGTIIPTINRYFYIVTEDIDLTNGANIPANLFTDDNGSPVTEFKLFSPNGYVNLYINAVMQEGVAYKVIPNSLIINPFNGTIFAGTPIIIESLGFQQM
ncbi:DUF4183 domain-containing protein [Lysinibacillus sphaericus]|uniref:DUF4183 domain-containing protein n=3 Tax=Lysinibacillus TaxID=400634 RepID=B1HMC4_LYSSC|nr:MULTISPECIES: DUF4183 domain-containing protein [Lysinibacillus]MBE5082093.1 DUF4183 domain-containing protein [Bacillus thuringiensis]ACA38696.1 hypothetical protein Bsph_1086 [Lysinibacillus sphaericus C3-41]AMO31047.1 hypothetical protein AR327_00135 [Lysinibacillus sphaericus]AMR89846.1 hypothetical protein A1T07_06540 [Lysinibacillus sphaericus]ANA47917.1 hypothetical protein A2J09_21745 [Lysinibacillus sphaericus]